MIPIEIKEKEVSNETSKKVVGTQIPQNLYDKLCRDAEEDFMSISDLLRKIIYLYYRNKEEKEKEVK